jgi:cobalt-zinc-cadmium efflux system outer membrane protein
MEARLLERAQRARDLVQIQYEKGAASLLELLDAQRTLIATKLERIQDLNNYWTAVFQVEEAVGTELGG